MPLSDREQQILQDIERQLYEQDPDFARGVTQEVPRPIAIRNARRGIALLVAGFAMLITYFTVPDITILGVAAFLVMVAGATFAFQNIKKAASHRKPETPETPVVQGIFGRVEQHLRTIRKRDDTN